MNPERGQEFMTAQANAYAARVKRKEINASAVENLLRADADHAGDIPAIRQSLFRFGTWQFAIAMKATDRGEVR